MASVRYAHPVMGVPLKLSARLHARALGLELSNSSLFLS